MLPLGEEGSMSFEESETQGYLLGISAGWGQAADFLLNMAADKFRAGDDETADVLRDTSERFRHMESLRRTEYDEYKEEHKEED